MCHAMLCLEQDPEFSHLNFHGAFWQVLPSIAWEKGNFALGIESQVILFYILFSVFFSFLDYFPLL
jgi:preprotein translocase subunit SecE